MARPKATKDPARSKQRLREIRARIAAMEYVCSGTLHERTKLCGKPNCACARQRSARHGPYYQWSRRKAGRQDNAVIPPAAALRFRNAISNYQELRRLLRVWEQESAQLILAEIPASDES
jgi:hypothetical protein